MTHGALTEDSLIDHIGKGREGKGREAGGEGSRLTLVFLRSGPEGASTPESPALTTRQHYLEGADG